MELSRMYQVTAFAVAFALCVFIWFAEPWLGSAGAGLSTLAKMAFAAAAVLYGAPALARLYREPADARFLRLRRGATLGMQWFVLMIIMLDVPLPSPQAITWLGAAAVLAGAMALVVKPAQEGTGAAITGFQLYAPMLVWALMAGFSLWPIVEDEAGVRFVLVLALGVAAPGPAGLAELRWQDWAMSMLAVTAALTGLFTAL